MGSISISNLNASSCVTAIVHAGVEFGVMDRGGHCINVGICRVNGDGAIANMLREKERRCRRAAAQLQVTPDGKLQMFFPRLGMLPCTARAIFEPGYFLVPLAYTLSDSIVGRLTPGISPVIQAGKYPVVKREDGYLIVF